MKIAVVYSNAFGNTKLLADSVVDTLGKDNVYYFGLPCETAINADRIYVGFWTDKGTADEISTEFIDKLKDKEIFLFGSAGFGSDPSYFLKILDSIKAKIDKSNKIIGEFMCQGKMKNSVRERYVSMKHNGVGPANIDMLIDNFDKALSHPDKNDFNNLRKEIKK